MELAVILCMGRGNYSVMVRLRDEVVPELDILTETTVPPILSMRWVQPPRLDVVVPLVFVSDIVSLSGVIMSRYWVVARSRAEATGAEARAESIVWC